MMQFELPKDKSSIIKVIGVGGGGSNAVNHMFRQGIKGVDFIVCNTDAQALDISPVPTKIQLGNHLTQGLGAGSIPEVGKNAALEAIDEIRSLLETNTKMVFITAGMGGGTGTGAAPIIAGVAKEMGVLTVGIVTLPFSFEGKKRKAQAEEGLENLKKNVDTLLIISNDKLREIHGNLKLTEAFSCADDILTTAAKSIAEIITVTLHINVDFADIQTVMKDSGVAIMGSASSSGENRAIRAVENALNSPLLNDNNIKGARYILLNITAGTEEITMDELGEITDYIQDAAGQTAEIIKGYGVDESLEDKVNVTIIATGFKTTEELGIEKSKSIVKVHQLETKITEQPVSTVEQKTQYSKEEIIPVTDEELSQEPYIIGKTEEQLSIELEVTPSHSNEPFLKKEPVVVNETAKIADTIHPPKEHFDMHLKHVQERSQERIEKLRKLSIIRSQQGNIAELEKEPAYKRRNVQLENQIHSSESDISRFTLSEDDEKKPEIKPNNSFLHDKVD